MEATTSIPSIFLPINGNLRSSEEGNRYKQLIASSMQPEEKQYLANMIISGDWTIPQVTKKFGLPRRTIRGWVEKITKDQNVVIQKPGRPAVHDQISLDLIRKTIIDRDKQKDAIPNAELVKLEIEEKKSSILRRKSVSMEDLEEITISESTVHRSKRKLSCSLREPQPLTDARRVACSCPRVSFTWLSLLFTYAGHLIADLKWNADSTTIPIDEPGKGTKVAVIREKGNPDLPEGSIHSSGSPSSLPYYIKWVHLCSAAGQMSPLVLHIAIEDMPEASCYVAPIIGLCTTNGNTGTGYIIFSKTRAGNDASWQWWFHVVCIPTIHQTWETLKAENIDRSRMKAFLYMDGESTPLYAGMDTTTLNYLRNCNIHFIKGPPSATNIHQACDRASTFKKVKKTMEQMTRDGAMQENDFLKRNLTQAFADLKVQFPQVDISSSYQSRLIQGCINLVYVFKNKVLTEKEIKNGFSICGQHRDIRPDLVVENNTYQGLAYSTIDADRVLGQCFKELSTAEREFLKGKLPLMVAEICRCGRLTDEFMDLHDIPQDLDHHVARDELVLWRQHAQELTHINVEGNWTNYLMERYIASDPEEKRKRKEQEDQIKFIHAYEKKMEDSINKELQKNQERERKNHMTPQEKEIEKARKATEKEQKKNEKLEKEAAEKRKYEEYKQLHTIV